MPHGMGFTSSLLENSKTKTKTKKLFICPKFVMLYITYLSSLSNWKDLETNAKTKTFVAIANATIIHILNSYYNLFLIYN